MKIAAIETGGKQYLVSAGQKIEVEKLPAGKGESAGRRIEFDKVLMTADGDNVAVGKPYLAGKTVKAEVIGEERRDKVITFKYHNKTRYRNKKGHRQAVASVRILNF